MKDQIVFDDFLKLDMRVGKVVKASNPDWSEKLLEFRVDFGSEIGKRTVLAGIKGMYEPEEFLGKKGVFIVNLPYRKMGESESQAMWLMGDPSTSSGQGPSTDSTSSLQASSGQGPSTDSTGSASSLQASSGQGPSTGSTDSTSSLQASSGQGPDNKPVPVLVDDGVACGSVVR